MIENILVFARVLSIIFIFIVIFIDKRKPESTIAWVLILTYVPYVGVFLYIMLGDLFHFNLLKKEKEKMNANHDYRDKLNEQIKFLENKEILKQYRDIADITLLNSKSGSLISGNNDIKVYRKGIDKYSDLFKDIENAKHYIHISYYIIRRDSYGKKLQELLVSKVKEGVEVRLMFDHIGSKVTSKKFFKELINAGGKVEKFFPSIIFFKPYLNHRNHRKIVIIDGDIAYTGGMNIGKEYCNEDKKLYPWCDTHLRILGDAVVSLQIQFFSDYMFVSKEKIDFNNPQVIEKYFHKVDTNGKIVAQIVSSGPDYRQENIKNGYLKMINNARDSILIETPYLILDDSLMDSLNLAIKSGVDVKIVIPAIPDKWFVYSATLSYARELIKMGVKVYAYKGFMHSKMIISDDTIVSIGSANMDRRSFFINFETNSFIYDSNFNSYCRELVNDSIKNSEFLNETIKKKNKFGLWLERIFRLLAPIM